MALITVFGATLTGRQSRHITVFVWECHDKQIFPKSNCTQFTNCNVKTLSRRLYSPSFKNVGWIEAAQLIFSNFSYICL